MIRIISFLLFIIPATAQAQHQIIIRGVTMTKELPENSAKDVAYQRVEDTIVAYGYVNRYYCVKVDDKMVFAPDKLVQFLGMGRDIDTLLARGDRIYDPLRLTNKIPPGGSFGNSLKSNPGSTTAAPSTNTKRSYPCGARTKTGGFYKRMVSGGGRCYQHGG